MWKNTLLPLPSSFQKKRKKQNTLNFLRVTEIVKILFSVDHFFPFLKLKISYIFTYVQFLPFVVFQLLLEYCYQRNPSTCKSQSHPFSTASLIYLSPVQLTERLCWRCVQPIPKENEMLHLLPKMKWKFIQLIFFRTVSN